ncbi:MAG: hypothetical protein LBD99_07380 [Candidatus Margulisbacteria bacterium]|jgi:hypothetical protein|nr:hypothetical protein [Candidatus Margulisiibacteriota bacterium]
MRRGFIYIRLQIYFALAVLICGGALFCAAGIIRQNHRLHRQLGATLLLTQALDELAEDLKYADAVALAPDKAQVSRPDGAYVYFLNNQRLVRRKDAYLYLTPADIALSSLVFSEEGGLLKIILTADDQVYERLVCR